MVKIATPDSSLIAHLYAPIDDAREAMMRGRWEETTRDSYRIKQKSPGQGIIHTTVWTGFLRTIPIDERASLAQRLENQALEYAAGDLDTEIIIDQEEARNIPIRTAHMSVGSSREIRLVYETIHGALVAVNCPEPETAENPVE